MKKNILYALVLLGITSVSILSCKKNNLIIDKDVVPPSYVKFNRLLNADTISTYYVNSTNDPFKLPVGVTAVSAKDRTIQFTYTSKTATAGTQFNGPATLVIPAGKSIDTLRFTGLFAGYSSASRIDTVVITITGGDIPSSAYNAKHILVLRKYCAPSFATTALGGAFANTREYTSAGAFSWGPYTTTVKNVVPTSATTATAQIQNMYDDGWNDINVVLDWTNPAAFKVTIPSQPTGKSYSGAPTNVRTSTASGAISTFSACDNTYSLSVDLVNGTTVISSNYRFELKK